MKVYAVTGFHGQSIKFASEYYFKVKGEGSSKYDTFVSILNVMISLPDTSIIFIVAITIRFIYPTVYYHVKKCQEHEKIFFKAHIWSLFLTSIGTNLALFTIHMISIAKLIEYGNEVLHNKHHFASDDHQRIPIYHAVFTTITMVAVYVVAMAYSVFILVSKKSITTLIAITIILNFVYIGCYFFPYMLLAFITYPLQTCFIYFLEVCFGACAYLLWYSLFSFALSDKRLAGLKILLTIWGAVFAIIYFLVAIVYILTLGHFDDFEEIQNLLVPLVIAVFTLFVFKPVHAFAKEFSTNENEEDNQDNNNGELITNYKEFQEDEQPQ